MKIKNIGQTVVKSLNNINNVVGKHSPLILTAAGVVGLGATAVFSYKAAKKMEVVVEDLENARELGLEVDRVELGKKIIGALALPVTTGVLSITAIALSYRIQNARIGALAAAFATATAEHQFYKNKYSETYGEEKTKAFYTPTTVTKREVTDEDGNVSTVLEETKNDIDTIHGVWFDKSTNYASDDHTYNMRFIRSCEEVLTNKMFSSGWLRMNEVFDKLGLERTRAGELFGWHVGGTNGFHIDTQVTNVLDQVTGEVRPEIYLKWSQPEYIYDNVEYKWA